MTPRSRLAARPHRGWRPCGVLAAVLLVLPVSGAVAAPRPVRPVRAVAGDLAGLTTITWQGTAGFRLRVPKEVDLPEADGPRLFVRGGTFAVVRMTADGLCPPDLPRFCGLRVVTYVRELAESVWRDPRPGRDHFALMATPPGLERATFDLYLFTDGVATLELKPAGLTGRRAYEAAGRIRGGVAPAQTSCPTAGCDPKTGYAGGRYRFGGRTRDVGALGYVESFAYSFDRTPYPSSAAAVPVMQPHPVQVCVYPSVFTPEASPKAADHPFGCDPPTNPETAEDAAHGTYDEVAWSYPASGLFKMVWNAHVRGNGYAGHRAGYVTDEPTRSRTGGYGVWFTHGVR